MAPDTSYLSAEERQVVNLLIEASGYMSEIYKRQRLADYDQARSAVANNRRADRDLLLAMFDRNFGPWDELAELHPFWGSMPMRSEEHTSELQSLMRHSYAVLCLKTKQKQKTN